MSRKLLLLILLALLIGTLNVVSRVEKAKASGTIYIREDGSIDPSDAPISTVDNVTYTLTDNINDSIVIGRDNIVVDGTGYTVQGTEAYPSKGIYLFDISNVTIKNMTIKAFYFGIYFDSSNYNSISGNNITENNMHGVYLNESSNYNSISGNNITNNPYGIYLWNSSNNSLFGNEMTANADCIYLDSSSNNTINGNNINGNNITENGIWLSSSSSNSINGNNITNNWDGICFDYSSNNSISGNNITNNTYGVSLVYSSNNNINGNTFLNDGLSVGDYSYGNVVSDNLVNGKPLVYLDGSSDYAVGDAGQVILVNCRNITVENQNLSNASVGVQLWGTNNTKIVGNNIIGNWNGIVLWYSYNNSIVGNTITNSWDGIWLLYSLGSRIFHNYFVGNNHQIHTEGSNNVWDDGYPSGGNYWSNLAGSDTKYGAGQNLTGSDGICDTSYLIDMMREKDNYPLMGMFSDFNATSECCVQTICNSSISDFQSNGTSISFNVTGEDGTAGFCRICIPTALMNVTYRVFVNGTETQCNLLSCSNSTHSYLYFNYTHSTEEVTITPEFPIFFILPFFMITTLLTVIICRRKTRISDVM